MLGGSFVYLLTKQELLIISKDAYKWLQLKQNHFYENKLTAEKITP